MSKYHKIRWTDDDEKELKRVVKNFNAKLNRLEKKDPQNYNKNTLPSFYDKSSETYTERLSVRQLKELINTRKDLKRELNALKRFSKRGSEQLVEIPTKDDTLKITKWQRREMLTRVNYINKRRAKRLDEIENTEVSSGGVGLGYTRGQLGMGKQELKALEPMEAFSKSVDKYSVKRKFATIMTQSQHDYFNARDYLLRESFIKGMSENYRPEDIQEVIKAIREMDLNDFLSEFYKDPNAFEWDYPPDDEKYQEYVNHLKSTWIPSYRDEVKTTKVQATKKMKTPKKPKKKRG